MRNYARSLCSKLGHNKGVHPQASPYSVRAKTLTIRTLLKFLRFFPQYLPRDEMTDVNTSETHFSEQETFEIKCQGTIGSFKKRKSV